MQSRYIHLSLQIIVMRTALGDFYFLFTDAIDKPIFIIDSSAPPA
jgi:hypothetical protein